MRYTCVKCGQQGLQRNATHNIDRSFTVHGRVFWEKYTRYYANAEEVELRKSDILCGRCYYMIYGNSGLTFPRAHLVDLRFQNEVNPPAVNNQHIAEAEVEVDSEVELDSGVEPGVAVNVTDMSANTMKKGISNAEVSENAAPLVVVTNDGHQGGSKRRLEDAEAASEAGHSGSNKRMVPSSLEKINTAMRSDNNDDVRDFHDSTDNADREDDDAQMEDEVSNEPSDHPIMAPINNIISAPTFSQEESCSPTAGPSTRAELINGYSPNFIPISPPGLLANNAENPVPHSDLLQEIRRKYYDRSLFNWVVSITHDDKEKAIPHIRKVHGNKCILQLWKLRCQESHNWIKMESIKDISEVAEYIEVYMKFLHTGEPMTLEDLHLVITTYRDRLINDFIFGLAVAQSVFALNENEISLVRQLMNGKKCFIPKQILAICLRVGSNRKDDMMEMYELILGRKCNWRSSNWMDGGDVDSFRDSDKENFFCWLYHRFSSNPTAPVLSFLFEKMKPDSSIEASESFTVNVKEVQEPLCSLPIRVHPLILQVRQGVNFKMYSQNINEIKRKLLNFCCPKRELHTFLKLLYYPGLEQLEEGEPYGKVPVLIKLCQAFIVEPIPILYGDLDSDDPRNLRIFMEIWEAINEFKYLDKILSEPYRYLTNVSVAGLRMNQFCYILKEDDLAMKEIDIYNVAIEFCNAQPVNDEEAQYQDFYSRFEKVSTCIRFGIMSDNDFEIVRSPSYLEDQDKCLFYYVIHNPEENMAIPDKFHKPTTPRRILSTIP